MYHICWWIKCRRPSRLQNFKLQVAKYISQCCTIKKRKTTHANRKPIWKSKRRSKTFLPVVPFSICIELIMWRNIQSWTAVPALYWNAVHSTGLTATLFFRICELGGKNQKGRCIKSAQNAEPLLWRRELRACKSQHSMLFLLYSLWNLLMYKCSKQ